MNSEIFWPCPINKRDELLQNFQFQDDPNLPPENQAATHLDIKNLVQNGNLEPIYEAFVCSLCHFIVIDPVSCKTELIDPETKETEECDQVYCN